MCRPNVFQWPTFVPSGIGPGIRENVSRLFGFSMQGLVDSKMKAFKKFHQELRYDRVE